MAQPTTTDTARRWAAITKSDTAQLSPVPAAIYCGSAGTLVAKGADGVSADFIVTAGQVLEIRPFFIMSTGTDVTGMVALYNDVK